MSREWKNLDPELKTVIMEHQIEAPVKVSSVAKALGLIVRASTLPAGISGEIRPDPDRPGNYIIRVNRHDSAPRQRFTVAHEIGHYLLHKDQIARGIQDDALYRSTLSDQREAEANRMAADILMPADLVEDAIARARILGVEDVTPYLAAQFEVSEAAMKIRLGLA